MAYKKNRKTKLKTLVNSNERRSMPFLESTYGLGLQFEGVRDLYKVFGYKNKLYFNDFKNMYSRNPIARRVVEALPNACWAKDPEITDDQDNENESEFEKAVRLLFKKHNIYSKLRNLDILQRIGSYGGLLIGTGSGDNVPLNKASELGYVMPYSEGSITIDSYVQDVYSPKFGMPEKYTIAIQNGNTVTSMSFDHTHVLHVSENARESNIWGESCLSPIYNVLCDLEKIVGGSAEAFWLNARGGLWANANDADSAGGIAAVISDYIHKQARVMATVNTEVSTLNYAVHSPEHQFSIAISCIAGATGMPKRTLTGSEQGQLASSQDERNWLSRIEERQVNFCGNAILRPFINRMIELGVLPKPKDDDYHIDWGDLSPPDAKTKAEIALLKIQAVNMYASGMADSILTAEQAAEITGFDYRKDEFDAMQKEENQAIDEQQKQDMLDGE